MPIFDYECPKCGAEERDVFTTPFQIEHACKCGEQMTRRPAVVNVAFKGDGWTGKFYDAGGQHD